MSWPITMRGGNHTPHLPQQQKQAAEWAMVREIFTSENGVYKMQVTETDGWLYQVCYMQQIDRYRHKFDWVVLLFRAASSQIKVKIKELRVISLLGNMRRADSIELENHMCIGGVHLILVCQLLSQDILHHWDRHLHEPASHAHHQQSCRKNNIK